MGIGFSRADADRFVFHLEKVRRHLATALQMVCVSSSGTGNNRSLASSSDAYYTINKSGFESIVEGPETSVIPESVGLMSELCDRVLLQCFTLAHNICEKYDLRTVVGRMKWPDNEINSQIGSQNQTLDISSMTMEERERERERERKRERER